jgi:hypothetical protein
VTYAWFPAQRYWWHDFDKIMRPGSGAGPGTRIEECGCKACADREAKYEMVDWPSTPVLAGPWREAQW